MGNLIEYGAKNEYADNRDVMIIGMLFLCFLGQWD